MDPTRTVLFPMTPMTSAIGQEGSGCRQTTVLETRLAILRRTALLAVRHDSGRPAKGNPGASSPDRSLAVGPVRCDAAVYGADGLRRPPAGRLTRLLPDPGPLREVRQGSGSSRVRRPAGGRRRP